MKIKQEMQGGGQKEEEGEQQKGEEEGGRRKGRRSRKWKEKRRRKRGKISKGRKNVFSSPGEPPKKASKFSFKWDGF